jgi:hypothetical protein
MKIAVFGLRDFKDHKPYKNYPYIASVLESYEPDLIISGGGVGIEELALEYAEVNGIAKAVVPPNIQAFGVKLGFVRRNEEILEQCDVVVLFWDGIDKHYVDLMAKAIAKEKTVHLYHVE